MHSLSSIFVNHENQELCFDPAVFLKESFSIDEFLRSHRNQATLEVLRNDLGTYLKTLRLSMIELINKDYEDFVNLSKDLVGLNAGIEVLQGPLEQVKSEIIVVKTHLEETISGLKLCLDQDKAIKEKKQSLFHLSQVIDTLKKLNTLLKSDSLIETNDLHLIERAASQYTMLHFSVSRCTSVISETQYENYKSIGEILMDLLNNTFLECLCERDTYRLTRCLRIYSNLDKVSEAETLVRKEVITPYLYDLINEASLQKEPEGLKGIYEKVLKYMDDQLAPLLQVQEGFQFDFLLNGLWVELERRIEVQMGSIFAAGDPNVFHVRFTNTSWFLNALRKRCKSPQVIANFDCHPQTVHFMQKWNLLVYYKIRFQEIAGQLECALNDANDANYKSREDSIYQLRVAAVANMCLERCWDNQVFIPDLAHVFWRLSLQILARYCVWVKQESNKDSVVSDETERPVTSNHVSSAHDLRLNFLISLHSDSEKLSTNAGVVLTKATDQLPKSAGTDPKVAASLAEATELLSSALSSISESVVGLLVQPSLLPLAQVNDIPRLFRRTNREAPTKSCDYVQHILQPLTAFYNNNKARIPSEVLKTWVTAVFNKISQQYYISVTEVLKNAQRTEESIRRLKKAKDKYSSITETKGSNDDDKIRQQLVVDVHAYCTGAEGLGIQHNSIGILKELVELVENARDKSERL